MTRSQAALSSTDVEKFGVNFCYQCKTCSAGCPVAVHMEYLPHQVVRKIQLGQLETLLYSRAIWYCASCETCSTRCPQGVDIPGLMDYLRALAKRRKTPAALVRFPVFHRLFLEGIRHWGRQYELSFLITFKLRVRDIWGDLGLGLKMMLRQKLHLLPPHNAPVKEVRDIFRRAGWEN